MYEVVLSPYQQKLRIKRQRFFLYVAILTGLLLISTPITVYAQPILKPVDQADRKADFFSFRAQLLAAIIKKDKNLLLAAVNKNIKNSFGGNDGIENFKKSWKIDQVNSPLWETLGTVLALGGTFDHTGSFNAPYTFSAWPDNVDVFENIAIIGDKVNIRATPTLNGKVLANVSYAILPLVNKVGLNKQLVAVKLTNGKTGYVSKALTRSSVDYRAIFEKVDGRWQLVAFIAGD